MTRADIEGIVHAFYETRLQNDVEACLAHFTTNACFRLSGSPAASGIACECRGQEALRPIAEALVNTWIWEAQSFHAILIDGNRVAAHYTLTARFAPTGERLETDLVDLITVEGGKVAALIEFVDTARAEALLAGVRAG